MHQLNKFGDKKVPMELLVGAMFLVEKLDTTNQFIVASPRI